MSTTQSTDEVPQYSLSSLVQLQYSRAKTFAAWSNLFRMMLIGDINAEDFDGLVSSIILPQIQSINNVFRGITSPAEASWAKRIQDLERERYNIIVKYQQLVIDHLSVRHAPPHHAKDHTHHHCCSHNETLSHTTACLFFVGNGPTSTGKPLTTVAENGDANRARIVANQKTLISSLMPTSSGPMPSHLSFGSQKTIPTSFSLSTSFTGGLQWLQPALAIDANSKIAQLQDGTSDSDAEEDANNNGAKIDFEFRDIVSNCCDKFRSDISASSSAIGKIEVALQETVDEALEELC